MAVIGTNSFRDTNLRQVTLEEGVKEIGAYAFSARKSLASVTLHKGLKAIGNSAFSSTALQSVVVPVGVEVIGELAFFCNTLADVTLPPPSSGWVATSSASPAATTASTATSRSTRRYTASPARRPSGTPKKYNIRLVYDYDWLNLDSGTAWDTAWLELSLAYDFSVIPQDLHAALVAHFKAKGQTITLGDLDALYHEYGHMLHYVILEKNRGFNSEWLALNSGIAYGGTGYDSDIVDTTFISTDDYHMGNIPEDVAETFKYFTMFTGSQEGGEFYERYSGTNIGKKAELLNRATASALKVGGAFGSYVPQAPAGWAADDIADAFTATESPGGRYGVLGVWYEAPVYCQKPTARAVLQVSDEDCHPAV